MKNELENGNGGGPCTKLENGTGIDKSVSAGLCATALAETPVARDELPQEADSKRAGAPDAWMETEEVAKYLGLQPKTVREGAARGTLPGHKYPPGSKRGRWLFKRAEIDRWLTRKPRVSKRKGLSAW
ncbi:MAG: excisionase family DNA binding protein [Candidatus Azotimanducaceae bacterium]|jgi:excisionase family DNA binding protein